MLFCVYVKYKLTVKFLIQCFFSLLVEPLADLCRRDGSS